MADLTPEEIALGVRAVKAGWRFELGDVIRWWWVDTPNDIRGPFVGREVSGDKWDPCSTRIPDVTARSFVSAALAQVRERVGRRCNIYCGDDADGSDEWAVWLGTGGHHGWAPPGRTEAEAVVAALEATRWSP